jgi:hypothetical protein
LKIFFQYSLRFADRLKRQPLISHLLLPHQKWLKGEADREIKSALRLPHQFLFRYWDLYFVMAFLLRPKMLGAACEGFGSQGSATAICHRARRRWSAFQLSRAAEASLNSGFGSAGPMGGRGEQNVCSIHRSTRIDLHQR